MKTSIHFIVDSDIKSPYRHSLQVKWYQAIGMPEDNKHYIKAPQCYIYVPYFVEIINKRDVACTFLHLSTGKWTMVFQTYITSNKASYCWRLNLLPTWIYWSVCVCVSIHIQSNTTEHTATMVLFPRQTKKERKKERQHINIFTLQMSFIFLFVLFCFQHLRYFIIKHTITR